MTVDELKGIIHEAISEDMEVWRETFEIMASGKKSAFVAWDDLKNA
jgi:hypothetical protein